MDGRKRTARKKWPTLPTRVVLYSLPEPMGIRLLFDTGFSEKIDLQKSADFSEIDFPATSRGQNREISISDGKSRISDFRSKPIGNPLYFQNFRFRSENPMSEKSWCQRYIYIFKKVTNFFSSTKTSVGKISRREKKSSRKVSNDT